MNVYNIESLTPHKMYAFVISGVNVITIRKMKVRMCITLTPHKIYAFVISGVNVINIRKMKVRM